MDETQERQKSMCYLILRTLVDWQIPALSSNECYIILLIIQLFLYIDYFSHFILLNAYNNTVCIDYFDASTGHVFHGTNNFFSITQLKQ